jgi:hypothetical protein
MDKRMAERVGAAQGRQESWEETALLTSAEAMDNLGFS